MTGKKRPAVVEQPSQNSRPSTAESRVLSLWRESDNGEDPATLGGELGIAEQLGVSRPALREAIARLEAMGVVYRRQGAATVVNRDALQLAGRFDEQGEFRDVIRALGASPLMLLEGCEDIELHGTDAHVFDVPHGTPALKITKRWDADDTPVRLAIDTLPLRPGEGGEIDPAESILTLVERLRGEPVTWELALPTAVSADDEIAALLNVRAGVPLLMLETIGLSVSGCRLYRSHDYHVPGKVPQGLIRTVRRGSTVPWP
ncbi:MAG: GntR family transcriptional regulator [Acidimicrobiaceae bacterium]|nr:GntR family transcriptional regulator [Acidimicrobiaceae bacterium]